MFGLDFLFASALWALPVALLPVLLHLLFRRKSPVVQFSTLRFIRSSLQHTAARKRVQKWLLLACRVLLLLLLIWAVSQPVKRLAASWGSGGHGIVAAVVVDTSYSMDLHQGEASLLNRADDIVQDLLRGPLHDGNVVIFRSLPAPPDQPERLQTATRVLSQWTALKLQPSPEPLAQRVAAAADFLHRQEGSEKWLVIISDLQRKEFPRALPDFPEGRTVLFDLHPADTHAAGVTKVSIEPPEPLPGIGSEVSVDVTGMTGDSRYAALSVTKPDGQVLQQKPPQHAAFDSDGTAQVRFPLQLPAERWLLLTAALQQDEPLPWAKTRSRLVETPPRQMVTVLQSRGQGGADSSSPAETFALALDPSQGAMKTWPLDVRQADSLSGRENVAVVPLTQWPAASEAKKLRDLAMGGGTVVLALKPGLEQSWPSLSREEKDSLSALLPSNPYPETGAALFYRVGVPSASDALLKGLIDDQAHFESIAVRRFVPLAAADPNAVSIVLNMSPGDPETRGSGSGAQPIGLLFRKRVGAGIAYTWATLPGPIYTNLATHTRFLPMMVRMCLGAERQGEAGNVELGEPLKLSGTEFAGYSQLEVMGPGKEIYIVPATTFRQASGEARKYFEFDKAMEPGLYVWRKPGDAAALAMTNVQLPASEAELSYRPAKDIAPVAPGPAGTDNQRVVIARTFDEFQATLQKIAQPRQEWAIPLAVVLLLLCFEALMGNIQKLRKQRTVEAVEAPAAQT